MRRRSTARRDGLPEYPELPTSLRTRREQFSNVRLSALLPAVAGDATGHDDQRLYCVAFVFRIPVGDCYS